MKTSKTTWLTALLLGIASVLIAVSLVLLYVNGQTPADMGPSELSVLFCAIVSLSAVGSLLSIHQPANPIGWIFLTAGISFSLLIAANSYALYITETAPGNLPEIMLLFWLAGWIWVSAVILPLTFGLLLFPSGALPAPRWRGFAWAAAVSLVLMAMVEMFAPGPLIEPPEAYPELTNPIAISLSYQAYDGILAVEGLVIFVFFAGSIASIFSRLRAASNIERLQLKWFAYAAIAPVVGLCMIIVASVTVDVGTAESTAGVVVGFGLALLPVTVGIAILRHNLYDIDRLINRTLVYGSLTALLLLGFAANVLLFQLILEPFTRGNDLAVAGSTLLVFALFRPIRDRLQRFVDRRFYRQRYDAQRTLQSFGVTARDAVDLDQLSKELTGVISTTIQPAHVSIWLRAEPAERDRI